MRPNLKNKKQDVNSICHNHSVTAKYFLFSKVKTVIKGTTVQNVTNITKNITSESHAVTLDAFSDHFVQLLKNVKSVL
jgi:hypothetical protein